MTKSKFQLEPDCSMADLTELLQAIDTGNQQAAAELLPVVYNELGKLAKLRLA